MGGVDKYQKEREFREKYLPDIRQMYYWHVRRDMRGKHEPKWNGHILWKFPADIVLYSQVIFANKPDWIIETGTAYGGSAVFFGDMLSLIGSPGKVLSIDISPRNAPYHPKVEYITGSSTDPEIVKQIRGKVSGKVMATLDSNHDVKHVRRELHYYSGIVTKGQYLVVEDCYTKTEVPYGPGRAVQWFLTRTDRYRLEPLEDQFLLAVTRGGWLRRIR